ncbi:MAG: dihydropteroate synthase [Fimbriiglobus sp.]|jgi:dihydropteroate synthase|nr:dihydropteroate synthase [Fimbriiglobus sp.]
MNDFPWHCRGRVLTPAPRPLVMGIVNVTPDSFSDGGNYFDPAIAVEHGLQLVADGADILDIGGESTRPGADPVPADEELRRVLPVVAELARRTAIPISIDTLKAEVGERCLDAGAVILNDVSGFRDPAMVRLAARTGAGVVVMHMQGDPQTMQFGPTYADVVREVDDFFVERIAALTAAGVDPNTICLDPGIGFGKTLDHTRQQLKHLAVHARHGRPVCLGVSRKGFLGQITGRPRAERAAATLAVNCFAVAGRAAHVLRVHDVACTRDAVLLWEQVHGRVE